MELEEPREGVSAGRDPMVEFNGPLRKMPARSLSSHGLFGSLYLHAQSGGA